MHCFRWTVLSVLAASFATAQTYHWSAFAGLPPQSGSRDGVGTEARFFLPGGLVGNVAGSIFVCDSGNSTIRLLSADGAVITLAGLAGQAGAADGVGRGARFNRPAGITISGGFLYVADSGNHAIRRVAGTGFTTTFAGRLGTAGTVDGNGGNARFNSPAAIANDGAGTLYVADSLNHVIRKITAEGEVSTVAGIAGEAGSTDGPATVARFNRPTGVYVASGIIYVADTNNHTIRRIAVDGTVTTVAGTAGLQGTTNATGAAARFRYPTDLVADSTGAMLVVDQTHTVRRVSATGAVTTFAGRLDVQGSRDGPPTDARFYVPSAIAFLTDGFVVSDGFNHSVRKLVTATAEVVTLAGSPGNFGREDGTGTAIGSAARFNFPNGVAVHSSGDVYLADSRGNSIRRISPAGDVVRIAGAGTGDAYIDGPAGGNSLNYPFGVAVAPDRTVYFCEQQRHTIRVLRPDGSVSTLAGREGVAGATNGTGDAARFSFPSGIALDRDGNLYVADTSNHAIRKITAGTNVVTTVAGQAGAAGSADGGVTARFRFPRGIAVEPDGNVIVADGGNHTLRRVTPAGDVSTIAGLAQTSGSANGAGAEARFFFPDAVAVDAQGTVFVADNFNHRIRRVVGNVVTTVGGIGLGYLDGTGTLSLFNEPTGIAVDASGTLYVSEAGNNIVRRGEPLRVPSISTQPSSVAIVAGGTSVLSVAASGGALTYQWRLNGVGIQGATNPTYTLTNASASNAGSYTVSVTNSLGTVTSQPAVVTLAAASDVSRLINLSLLTGLSQPGDNFTMGFVIGGAGTSGSKPLLIRAAGPSLGALGVPGTVDDPKLELFFGANSTGANDNWGGAASLAAAMNAVGAFAYTSTGSLDAATAAAFQPGNNSVKVSAAGNGTGSVLAEIYDATPTANFTSTTPRLVNVSVLKEVGTGVTAGFAIGGIGAKTVLIRAVGPTLGAAPFGLSGALADPQLTLFSGATPIATNDNWGGTAALSAAFTQVGAFQLAAASRDAVIMTALQPGTYTVQASGVGGTTGLALIEIYEVP